MMSGARFQKPPNFSKPKNSNSLLVVICERCLTRNCNKCYQQQWQKQQNRNGKKVCVWKKRKNICYGISSLFNNCIVLHNFIPHLVSFNSQCIYSTTEFKYICMNCWTEKNICTLEVTLFIYCITLFRIWKCIQMWKSFYLSCSHIYELCVYFSSLLGNKWTFFENYSAEWFFDYRVLECCVDWWILLWINLDECIFMTLKEMMSLIIKLMTWKILNWIIWK